MLTQNQQRHIVAWLRRRPAARAIDEIATLRREFDITRDLARELRMEAARSSYIKCGCCTGVGDHPCGHECTCCNGSGCNPKADACTAPHGADCTCDWGECCDWTG